MTIAAVDPGLLSNYDEPKYLLHFQWKNSDTKIYRYALVEEINIHKIDHRLKLKEDEQGLTQEDIWLKKYSYNNIIKRYHTYRNKDMARKKFNVEKIPHERIPKRTSIGGGRVKMSSMNKHKKRSYKRKNRGGM